MSNRTGRGNKGTWIQLLILRILYETHMHGYALNEKINSFQSGRQPIKPGGLYTILRRMEKEGLLESIWDKESSRLSRRVYKLSDFGVKRLKEGRRMVKNQIAILMEMKQFYEGQFKEIDLDDNE